MKNLLLSLSIASLSLLTLGCKKETDVDPRDQYIGTYATNESGTLTRLPLQSTTGTITSTNATVDITISKASETKRVLITIPNMPSLVAELADNTFSFSSQSLEDTTATGYPYWRNYYGNGSFQHNEILLNLGMMATTDHENLHYQNTFTGSKR